MKYRDILHKLAAEQIAPSFSDYKYGSNDDGSYWYEGADGKRIQYDSNSPIYVQNLKAAYPNGLTGTDTTMSALYNAATGDPNAWNAYGQHLAGIAPDTWSKVYPGTSQPIAGQPMQDLSFKSYAPGQYAQASDAYKAGNGSDYNTIFINNDYRSLPALQQLGPFYHTGRMPGYMSGNNAAMMPGIPSYKDILKQQAMSPDYIYSPSSSVRSALLQLNLPQLRADRTSQMMKDIQEGKVRNPDVLSQQPVQYNVQGANGFYTMNQSNMPKFDALFGNDYAVTFHEMLHAWNERGLDRYGHRGLTNDTVTGLVDDPYAVKKAEVSQGSSVLNIAHAALVNKLNGDKQFAAQHPELSQALQYPVNGTAERMQARNQWLLQNPSLVMQYYGLEPFRALVGYNNNQQNLRQAEQQIQSSDNDTRVKGQVGRSIYRPAIEYFNTIQGF